ncbi:MAG: cation diffusion facilitator family transporter [Anaerolineales bacterium]
MPHKHDHFPETSEKIRTAFLLNLGFAVLELFGGWWANSVAILSDAVHDLGDSFSLGLAWYLNNISQREKDARFSYGYHRFSLLGALLNAGILIGGAIFVLSKAIPRLLNPESVQAPRMILFAVIGALVNGAAALNLRDSKNLNARLVSWHLMEDMLGWIAVLIVSLILLFVDLPILDPILSILITGFVTFNVLKNLRETIGVFLQSVPGDIDVREIDQELQSIPGVVSTHHTHVWSLDGENHVLTTHINLGPSASREKASQVKEDMKSILEPHDFFHLTVEIEFGEEDCAMC